MGRSAPAHRPNGPSRGSAKRQRTPRAKTLLTAERKALQRLPQEFRLMESAMRRLADATETLQCEVLYFWEVWSAVSDRRARR